MSFSPFQWRRAALLGLLAACLLPAARADELFVASKSTLIAKGDPYMPDLTVIGACGGQAHSMTMFGPELRIGDPLGRIYRWKPGDFFVQYAYDVPNDAMALAVHAGNLLSGGSDGKIARVDATTGALIATLDVGIPVTALLVSGDTVYAGSSFGVVFKGHAINGGFQFFGTCGGPVSALAIDSTHLILASSNSHVYRVNLITQQINASFPVSSDAAAMVLHLGDLLVGGSDASLVRLDRFTGALKSNLGSLTSVSALAVQPDVDPGTAYCYGIGCPCGNDDPNAGCENSTGFGARLAGSGTASVTADDLAIHAFQLPINRAGRFYMSSTVSQIPFGAGFLCTGGGGYPIFRFPPENSGASGAFAMPDRIVSWCQQNLGAPGQIHPGQTWHFQGWYRNKGGPCGASFNTTNALAVTFLP